ncbi:hypothetical protein D3C87_1326620 [compost metagenome]
MKIELRNIEYSERQSEETNCFIADLFIDGKLAGTTRNNGHGGSTDYFPTGPEGRKLIETAEEYCRSLPAEEHEYDGQQFTLDMDLELYIDKLLGDYLSSLEQKKTEAKMKKNILVSSDPGAYYGYFELGHPIEALIATPKGKEYLLHTLRAIVPQMKEQEKIINTNIPEQILKEAGLREDQYMPQKLQGKSKKEASKQQRKRP